MTEPTPPSLIEPWTSATQQAFFTLLATRNFHVHLRDGSIVFWTMMFHPRGAARSPSQWGLG